MKNDQPLVSIGLPTFNGENFIRESLDSLLKQDYPGFELIISDNASNDKTPEICLEYQKRDKRIRFYRNEKNLGPCPNFRQVFELSKGKYFMWASDHDLWDKSFINKCLAVLESDPQASLCYTDCNFIDVYGNKVKQVDFPFDTRNIHDPAQRFYQTLWVDKYLKAYMIYGLIRSDMLRQTTICADVILPDTLTLLELSLLGTFAQVNEKLYSFRKNRPWESPEAGRRRYVYTLGGDKDFPFLQKMLMELKVIKKSKLTLFKKIKLSISSIEYYRVIYKVYRELFKILIPRFTLKGIKLIFKMG